MFAREEDYRLFIQDDLLTDLLRGSQQNLRIAEQIAKSEMSPYLASGGYDLPLCFVEVPDWSQTQLYTPGMAAYDTTSQASYIAQLDNTGKQPSLNEGEGKEWIKGDPRDMYLVKLYIDVVLYHAHVALSGQNIPGIRVELYELAIKVLERIASGSLQPDLPKTADAYGSIVYGSNPKRQHHY